MKRVLVSLLVGCLPAGAFAADYPVKPIRIISPFPPGGSVDLVARILGADLSKSFGQQVIIDNRSGATGMIGTELAKNARARRLHAAHQHPALRHQPVRV